jgi:hypothetical protein
MAQPSPFSNVPTTNDIATQRKLALALQGQAIDTSPVGHWTQALARAVQGGVGGMNQSAASAGEKSRQDALAKALAGSGTFGSLSEGDRALMTQNPEVMQSVVSKGIGAKFNTDAGKTEGIKEYEYAVKSGFKGTLQDWMISRRATQGEYNKNPIFGTRIGPDGKPQTVMLQAGSRGDAAETKLPEGVSVNAQKPIEVDAGTHTVLLDPITRQPIAQIPKNVGAAAREREVGTETGKAQVSLPTVESNAKQLFDYIDSVANDKNLDKMLGYGGYLPNVSTGARTLQTKINQLNNSAFLMAFERLKGGGAITEIEGQKATEAMTRLREMVQSGQDYREALRDFRGEVQRLLEVAKRKAGVGGPNGNAGFSQQGQTGQGVAPGSYNWTPNGLQPAQ